MKFTDIKGVMKKASQIPDTNPVDLRKRQAEITKVWPQVEMLTQNVQDRYIEYRKTGSVVQKPAQEGCAVPSKKRNSQKRDAGRPGGKGKGSGPTVLTSRRMSLAAGAGQEVNS